METIYLLKFLLFWLSVGAIVSIVIFFIREYRIWKMEKRIAEINYEKHYVSIQGAINSISVCKGNYIYIKARLRLLGKMKYGNREKTEVLTDEFHRRFIEFAKKELSL